MVRWAAWAALIGIFMIGVAGSSKATALDVPFSPEHANANRPEFLSARIGVAGNDTLTVLMGGDESTRHMQPDSFDRHDKAAVFFMKGMIGVVIFILFYTSSKFFR